MTVLQRSWLFLMTIAFFTPAVYVEARAASTTLWGVCVRGLFVRVRVTRVLAIGRIPTDDYDSTHLSLEHAHGARMGKRRRERQGNTLWASEEPFFAICTLTARRRDGYPPHVLGGGSGDGGIRA
jgi:hypothetical protein